MMQIAQLFDIFTYPFFQKALLGGLLIGIMAPLVGSFLVFRRLSMIGDTLSHALSPELPWDFLSVCRRQPLESPLLSWLP